MTTESTLGAVPGELGKLGVPPGNGHGLAVPPGNGHGVGEPPGNGHGLGAPEGPTAPPALDPHAAASITAAPVQVAPGEVANATLSVTNLRAEPCSFALSLAGLEPGWYGIPERVGPLAPGESAHVPFHVALPRGYPPCSILVSVEARPLPGDANGGGTRRSLPAGTRPSGARRSAWTFDERRAPGRHDLVVVVGDGATVAARLDPADVKGGGRGRFALHLRNRGGQSHQVRVDGVSPDPHLELHFDPAAPLLLPGREVKVTGRIRSRRHLFGGAKRHPFTVRVQGRGTPTQVEGSYTSHSLLPSWASKSVVILLVMALWAAVAVVGIKALSNHLHNSAAQKVSLSPSKGKGHSTSPTTGAPGSSSSSGTAKTGKTAKSGSSSTSPTSSKGSSGSGSSGSSGSSSSSTGVEVAGKVSGSHPGDVTVTLAPTSLVSTQVTGASSGSPGATLDAAHRKKTAGVSYGPGAVLTSAVHRRGRSRGAGPRTRMPMLVSASHKASPLPDGKVYGTEAAAAFFPALTASVTPTLTTQTAPDGSYVFTGVTAPGTYLVSFTEAGYNTRKYVVQTTKGKAVALNTALSPGTGSLSGTVSGPAGRLGGVSVTVTNGSVTLTTVTPTTGSDVGTWSVTGLNTPDSYSVSASASEFGTQITNASLAASASLAGVDLKLEPGVGSISGNVSGATSAE
ncbi:MAG: hypothetical protein ACRDWE_00705, partial [Acidimicrobiales bacterium]